MVSEIESGYRFLVSAVENLLEQDRVLHARAAADPTLDLDSERDLRALAERLALGLERLERLCARTDLLAYQPRVIDPEQVRRSRRRIEAFVRLSAPLDPALLDREGARKDAESLRAVWGA
jgi:hypothetical protein